MFKLAQAYINPSTTPLEEDRTKMHIYKFVGSDHTKVDKLICATSPNKYDHQCMYMYIVSNDKIYKGDWYIELAGRQYPLQWDGKENLNLHCRKIVLTTDENITTNDNILPRPKKEIIEQYIELYNNKHYLIDVALEYSNDGKLKVNEDNEVEVVIFSNDVNRDLI